MRGWGTVTVPGAVGGWAALSQRFGDVYQQAAGEIELVRARKMLERGEERRRG